MRPICFISDYGLSGELVGICKGVMMGIAPGVSIIDVTHSVPEFDVVRGAETLRHATGYMPEDAVYLAVIDPEDKPARRELAAETGSGAYLVGPDNGLLLPAAEALGGVTRAVLLTNPEYHLHPVSNSFHGRDVFSPVAAHLAAGAELDDLGEEVDPASLSSIDFPGARREGDASRGRDHRHRQLRERQALRHAAGSRPGLRMPTWRSRSATKPWTQPTCRPSGPPRTETSCC